MSDEEIKSKDGGDGDGPADICDPIEVTARE